MDKYQIGSIYTNKKNKIDYKIVEKEESSSIVPELAGKLRLVQLPETEGAESKWILSETLRKTYSLRTEPKVVEAWHREQAGVIDGICVDCEKFYECSIREAAEIERHSHIVECGRFMEAKPKVVEAKQSISLYPTCTVNVTGFATKEEAKAFIKQARETYLKASHFQVEPANKLLVQQGLLRQVREWRYIGQ